MCNRGHIIFKIWIFCSLLVILLWHFHGSISSARTKKSDPIKIAINNWTSQRILSHIAGRLFEKQGYKVEYIKQDTYEQWGALYRGGIHVQPEVWEGTNAKLFSRMVKEGGVVDAGTHDAKTREDWWYPSYVEELCPGLPDWQALKRCYALFVTEQTHPYGQYLAGPWEKPDRARIRALDMNFKVVEVENGEALNEKLFEAISNQTPIVLFNWSPNWVNEKFQGKFVEFPAYEPACESDPGWGVNPSLLYDCGNPKTGWLKKAAWAGMPEKWPCAFEILKRMNFNNKMISKLVFMKDIEKKTVEEITADWLKNNRMIWKSWIMQGCIPPLSESE